MSLTKQEVLAAADKVLEAGDRNDDAVYLLGLVVLLRKAIADDEVTAYENAKARDE